MHEALEPLPKHLPPKTRNALQQAIHACGQKLGMPDDWVQRWLSLNLVADAPTRRRADAPTRHRKEGEPAFELKGGAAIELRLRRPRIPSNDGTASGGGIVPRATRDLDATFHGSMDELQAAVEDALAAPHPEFRFRAAVETPEAPHMRRNRVRVAYLQKGVAGTPVPWDLNSVKLEVSCYEGTRYPPEMVPAYSLKPFGIEGPSELPCLPLPKQVAQKLHAVTEIREGDRKNDRFRDLLDIVMLSTLVPPSRALRDICEETFTLRGKHGWPPEVVAHPEWIGPMEQRAVDMGLPTRTADEIIAYVTGYVARIAEAA